MKSRKSSSTTPDPRSGHILLSSPKESTVYLVGGHTTRGPLTDVWSYEDKKEHWKLLHNDEKSRISPLPRFEFDGCLAGPFIYLFGGFQSDGEEVSILNDLWVFDLEYQTWNLISEECTAPERSGHVVVAIDSARFMVHGGTCMGSRGDLWLYDTSSDHWEEIVSATEPPCPRSMHSAVFCEGSMTLAVFGGVTHHGNGPDGDLLPVYLNDLWVMKLSGDLKKWSWNMVQYEGFAPSPRDLPALVAVGSGVILFGGFGFVEIADDISESNEGDGPTKTNSKASNSSDNQLSGQDTGSNRGEIVLPTALNVRSSSPKDGKSEKQRDGKCNSPRGSRDQQTPVKAVKAQVAFDEEEADDDSMLAIDYLSDAWHVNLETGESTEIDLCSLSSLQDDDIDNNGLPASSIPRRGCKLISAGTGKIISFGGFDGENFYGKTEELSTDILQNLLSETSHTHDPSDPRQDISSTSPAINGKH